MGIIKPAVRQPATAYALEQGSPIPGHGHQTDHINDEDILDHRACRAGQTPITVGIFDFTLVYIEQPFTISILRRSSNCFNDAPSPILPFG